MSRNPDSPGGAPSQGPQRAPALALDGQRQAGPGSWRAVGLPRLPSPQGRRSAGAPPGWPWAWPGPEETREPGLGRCPWGLQVSSSRLHSPERGSTEGVFQAGKGRSRCVPDVGTCSRKRKAAVQRPSPHPAVRQPWGPGMEVQFLPLLPWLRPTQLSVTSFLHPSRMWPARPSPGASVLRASGRSSSWRLPVGCHERNAGLEPSAGLPPVPSWGLPFTLSTRVPGTTGLPQLPSPSKNQTVSRTGTEEPSAHPWGRQRPVGEKGGTLAPLRLLTPSRGSER